MVMCLICKPKSVENTTWRGYKLSEYGIQRVADSDAKSPVTVTLKDNVI